MRNHGNSFRDPHHRYSDLAGDLARVVAALGGRADVLGHSMGGKAAMVLALTRPELVNHLVVADIAPVAYNHTQQGLVKAMQSVDLAQATSRAQVDAQLQTRVADAGVRAFLMQSLERTENGWRWQINLDVLGAEMEQITGFPSLTGSFSGPTLFVSGENSDYVLPTHQETIKRLFPAAEYVSISGAGHWLHAEKPAAFLEAVEQFLTT